MRVGMIAGLLLILGLCPSSARAGCGVDLCPEPRLIRGPLLSWVGDFTLRSAGFSFFGARGHYQQFIARSMHRAGRWTFGGAFPVHILSSDASNASGLGNAFLFVERRFYGPFSAGAQLELPGTGGERGLSSNHPEFLPYAAADVLSGPARFSARAGARVSLAGAHSHGAAVPLLVEPHGDREFVYRVSAAYVARYEPTLYLSGQHSFSGLYAGAGFAFVGASLERSFADGWFARPFVELPISAPRRFDHRAGFTAGLRR